jgi:stearoyl-CoA desaturase (delta-9 desaturase)
MRDHRVFRSRHFHKLQRRHFIVFDVLPFLGTLVALGLLFYRPIGAVEVSLFFSMWLLTGFGLTVGYHRLFTHRAFSTGVVTSCIFIVMGSMAGRGPIRGRTVDVRDQLPDPHFRHASLPHPR